VSVPAPRGQSRSRPSGRHTGVSSAVVRRRRTAALVIVAIVITVLVVVTAGGSGKPRPALTSTPILHGPSSIPAVEAGLLPWSLDAALSREVVLPGPAEALTVVGGLSVSSTSLDRVFSLDTTNGHVSDLGTLAAGVHDAAGAQLGSKDLIFGGGTPLTVADTEQLSTATGPSAVAATAGGRLPQPRSDLSAVTIGSTAYLVGGYDGAHADPQVLATTDGRRFSVVTTLPVPVRYPAVAAFAGKIYAFGGEAVKGAASGAPVDAVQVVDPVTRTAKEIGHLPHPIMGAAAAVLGGHLYVAGGVVAATGGTNGAAVADVWAFDPATDKMVKAGNLPVPVAYTSVGVVGPRAWLVGGESDGTPLTSVEMFTPNSKFGTAGSSGAGSPFYGAKLLIADRGNDRLLVLDDTNRILWTYPSVYAAAPPGGFYFPDDAFFAHNGTQIISNQEMNETIVVIGFPSGSLRFSYGHAHQTGAAAGYLHTPDDAYILKNGQVTVADAENCRVLFIEPSGSIVHQIGTSGVCKHQPPDYLGSPNGDTPLADGNVLISEINGSWVSEYTPQGKLVWTVQLPVHYPSDAQQLGPDLYLLADYNNPGAIVEFNREGQILYRYQPTSGGGVLSKPSLAEILPSGVFMTNDDYRDRMVAIDPTTQALVWQYGVTDTPGTAAGMLNIPDGFDLLLPNGTTPTHTATG
jgi:N-acetylneuraminic acid mutarotase